MPDFDTSVLWPAFKAAGMLKVARVTSGGTTRDVDVGFVMPNRYRLNGKTGSADYEMEYQDADLPLLAEGDPVTLDPDTGAAVAYRVRQPPTVPDIPAQGDDGTYRRALLTKVA